MLPQDRDLWLRDLCKGLISDTSINYLIFPGWSLSFGCSNLFLVCLQLRHCLFEHLLFQLLNTFFKQKNSVTNNMVLEINNKLQNNNSATVQQISRRDRMVYGVGFVLLRMLTRQSGVRAQLRCTSACHTRSRGRLWTWPRAPSPAVSGPTRPLHEHRCLNE